MNFYKSKNSCAKVFQYVYIALNMNKKYSMNLKVKFKFLKDFSTIPTYYKCLKQFL